MHSYRLPNKVGLLQSSPSAVKGAKSETADSSLPFPVISSRWFPSPIRLHHLTTTVHWCIVIHYYCCWQVAVNSFSLDQLRSYCLGSLGSKVTLELMCVVEFGSCSNLRSVVVVLHFFLSLSFPSREIFRSKALHSVSLPASPHTCCSLSRSRSLSFSFSYSGVNCLCYTFHFH